MRNNLYKTIIAGGVILSMTTLAACGGKGSTTTGSTDAGASTDNAKQSEASGPVTVTLSVKSSNRFLDLAKQKFEESHPGIKIEIKETIAAPKSDGKMVLRNGEKPDPKDTEKFVTTVNTELMSGKASDIIVTDGSFPYKKYADKKLLENIGDLMKNDSSFKRDDYYTNVFDAMVYKNAIYALPAKLSINWLIGDQAALGGAKIADSKWTWKDFKEVVEPFAQDANKDGVQDGFALINTDAAALFSLMVDSSYGKLVDWSAKKFDSQSFTDMLKLSKAMSDAKLVTKERLDRANVLFQTFTPMQYEDMIMILQMQFAGNGALYNVPSYNDAKGLSFTSDTLLSINAKSKQKKEAWEFVKFMLSEEMQTTRDLMGFAVHKKASQARQEQLKEIGASNGKMQLRMMGPDGKQFSPKPAEQKDIDRIEQALASVRSYAETDPTVMAIIEQEAAPFFSGQKSAEEVAKTVQNKVNTYLQE
jgi:multiple sugar transport system substrate-binding protein